MGICMFNLTKKNKHALQPLRLAQINFDATIFYIRYVYSEIINLKLPITTRYKIAKLKTSMKFLRVIYK